MARNGGRLATLLGALILSLLLLPGCTPKGVTAMVEVPGGPFEMGCDHDDCEEDEGPIHTVNLTDFSISRYEVTYRDYVAFLNRSIGSADVEVQAHEDYPTLQLVLVNGVTVTYIGFSGSVGSWIEFSDNTFSVAENYENYPVPVSWLGAQFFCESRNMRLPTEAEWEYAARGGRYDAGYVYSGSNTAGDVAHYSRGGPAAIGQKEPNQLGIYDMSGNMKEWIYDSYDPNYYSVSPAQDPRGPTQGFSRKVLRGGAFNENAHKQRVTNRDAG